MGKKSFETWLACGGLAYIDDFTPDQIKENVIDYSDRFFGGIKNLDVMLEHLDPCLLQLIASVCYGQGVTRGEIDTWEDIQAYHNRLKELKAYDRNNH